MPELEKAFLELENGSRIPCLFNPSEISVQRSNNWSGDAMPGKGVPQLQYNGANSASMSLELVFDTTADGSPVTKYTGKIMGLMDVDTSLPGTDETTNNARPQTVTFHWGDLHSFPAVVTDVGVSFTYFSSSGVPLRANVHLGLMQYQESHAFGPQNPTSGTPRPHRVHRVQPGETLDRVSARYYGDPTRWRELAAANGIEDPLAIRPGTLLSIPRKAST
jgi:hypothetical protein